MKDQGNRERLQARKKYVEWHELSNEEIFKKEMIELRSKMMWVGAL